MLLPKYPHIYGNRKMGTFSRKMNKFHPGQLGEKGNAKHMAQLDSKFINVIYQTTARHYFTHCKYGTTVKKRISAHFWTLLSLITCTCKNEKREIFLHLRSAISTHL